MKVGFTGAKIGVTFGEYEEMDIAEAVGNAIRQNTSDIGVDETARDIYHFEGEPEIPDEQISAIIYTLSSANIILVSAKRTALNLLELTQE